MGVEAQKKSFAFDNFFFVLLMALLDPFFWEKFLKLERMLLFIICTV